MNNAFFSVSQVNSYVKSLLEEDVILSGFFIRGEVSNLKIHSSGHIYFTLKDNEAAINCVMFKYQSQSLTFTPKNGDNVMIYGRASIYEKTGTYQLYAELMEPLGKGQLYIRYEALKSRLDKEGLFDMEKKRQLPDNPERVAIITSPTSAALRDMLKMARVTNPTIQIVVVPSLVQGDRAPSELVAAISEACRYSKADFIIMGRGGGSIEDLWAFNDEAVARAIRKSSIPVVTAIGHETDFTIADFAADLRAPTPSAAISMTFPDIMDIIRRLLSNWAQFNYIMEERLQNLERDLENLDFAGIFDRAARKNERYLKELEKLTRRLCDTGSKAIEGKISRLNAKALLLESLSPLKVLNRGYSLTMFEGKAVRDSQTLEKGDKVQLVFASGSASAEIISTHYGGEV